MLKKKSVILMIITFCTLVIISSSLLYNIYLAKVVEVYPSVVNNLGVIRGSIQRLIQLETNGTKNDDLIYRVDDIFFQFNNKHIEMYNNNENLRSEVNALYSAWYGLKLDVYEYRNDPSPENKEALMAKSQDVWLKSNSTVYMSQIISENTIKNNRILFFMSAVNILIVILTIITIKKYVHDNLEYAASHDALTGLYNRGYFYDNLIKRVERAQRTDSPLSLIIFDIDHFKKVNDTYGHDVGDYVLKELAATVSKIVRKNDVLARVGGEEFALLLEGCSFTKSLDIAEAIRRTIDAHLFDKVGHVTISLGVTELAREDNIDTIYKRADQSLYTAKNNGRNRVEGK